MALNTTQYSQEYLDQDGTPLIVGPTTAIVVVSTLLLYTRLQSRRLNATSWGWDDWLLPPAYLGVLGTCTCVYLIVHFGGAGRHLARVMQVNPHGIVTSEKTLFAMMFPIIMSNALSRISICVLYQRVFTTKWSRIMTWMTATYLAVLGVGQTILIVVECIPPAFYWTEFEIGHGPGKCINQYTVWEVNGVLNIVGDVALLLLPISTIYHLDMPLTRKMEVATVFASGSLGIVASVLRTIAFWIQEDEWNTDPTWANIPLFTWTVVETGMYLIAACLIGSRAYFSMAWSRITGVSTKCVDLTRSLGGSVSVPFRRSAGSVEDSRTDLVGHHEKQADLETGMIHHNQYHQSMSENDIGIQTDFQLHSVHSDAGSSVMEQSESVPFTPKEPGTNVNFSRRLG